MIGTTSTRASAATFTVTSTNNSGPGSLRTAISQANSSGLDTIKFDPSLSGQTIALAPPSLEITDSDTIDASDLAAPITLDGQDLMRIMIIRDTAVGCVIKSLRFVDGRTTSSSDGAALVNQGVTALDDCEFVSNRTRDTGDGGAIQNQGVLVLRRCLFDQNSAGAEGGAIHNVNIGTFSTSLKAIDCTFSNNAAATSGNNEGGAYAGQAGVDATFFGCTFTGNSTTSGGFGGSGGAVFTGGTFRATNCTFSGNTGNSGGALRFPASATKVDLVQCTISGNTSLTGDNAGISTSSSDITLINTISYGNTGINGPGDITGDFTAEGGNLIGVHISGTVTNNGLPILTVDPLLGPLADNGGPTLTMLPSISSPAFDAGDSAALPADTEDLDDDSNSTESLPIDQRGQSRDEGAAPDLGAVELPAFLFTLQESPAASGSITLSGGFSAGFLPAGTGITLTAVPQPGFTFSSWSGDASGSFHDLTIVMDSMKSITASFVPNPSPGQVQNNADTGPGSLRNNIVEATSGDTITFDSSLSGLTINLGGTQLLIDKNLTIDASALPGGITISGDVTGDGPTPDDSRLVEILLGNTVTLHKLTLTGGHEAGTFGGAVYNLGSLEIHDSTLNHNSADGLGGAIYNLGMNASLSITDCILDHNSSALEGGAISNADGIATVTGSTLTNNVALRGGALQNTRSLSIEDCILEANSADEDGGAIYNDFFATVTLTGTTISSNNADGEGGALYNAGTAIISGTTFSNNAAGPGLGTFGGAIRNAGSSASLSIEHGILSGNTAGDDGGAIYNGGSLSIENGILSGNTTGDDGGAIRNTSGTVRITGTTIAGNNADDDGGGVSNSGFSASLSIENSTMAGNTAMSAGGAIGNRFSAITSLSHVTISDNTAIGSAGGICNSDSVLSIENTIVAGNTAPLDENLSGAITELGNNLSTGDPLLAPLGDYGGPTPTMPPLPNSPVIEAALDLAGLPNLSGHPNGFGARCYEAFAPDALEMGVADQTRWLTCIDPAANLGNNGAATFRNPSDTSDVNRGSPNSVTEPGFPGITESYSFGSAIGFAQIWTGASPPHDTASTGDAAFEIWFKPDTLSGGDQVLFEVGGSNQGIYLALQGDQLVAYCKGLLQSASTTVTLSDADWTQVVVNVVNSDNSTADDQLQIFVNGVFIAQSSSVDLGDWASSDGCGIGGATGSYAGQGPISDSNASLLFQGEIAAFRFFERNLSSSGVLASYNTLTTSAIPSVTDQRSNPRPTGPLPDLGAVEANSLFLGTLTDTDNDGIPDLLEGSSGPYPHLTVGVDDSEVDTDGDGSTDANEIAGMTDLNDPRDAFRILSFIRVQGFDPLTHPVFDVTISTFPGLDYSLEHQSDLALPFDSLGPTFTAGDYTETRTVTLDAGRDFLRAKHE